MVHLKSTKTNNVLEASKKLKIKSKTLIRFAKKFNLEIKNSKPNSKINKEIALVIKYSNKSIIELR